MKRGAIISEIRKLARTGLNFTEEDFSFDRTRTQPVICWLFRNGELTVSFKGKRGRYGWPATYRATRKLAKVNSKKPLIK